MMLILSVTVCYQLPSFLGTGIYQNSTSSFFCLCNHYLVLRNFFSNITQSISSTAQSFSVDVRNFDLFLINQLSQKILVCASFKELVGSKNFRDQVKLLRPLSINFGKTFKNRKGYISIHYKEETLRICSNGMRGVNIQLKKQYQYKGVEKSGGKRCVGSVLKKHLKELKRKEQLMTMRWKPSIGTILPLSP